MRTTTLSPTSNLDRDEVQWSCRVCRGAATSLVFHNLYSILSCIIACPLLVWNTFYAEIYEHGRAQNNIIFMQHRKTRRYLVKNEWETRRAGTDTWPKIRHTEYPKPHSWHQMFCVLGRCVVLFLVCRFFFLCAMCVYSCPPWTRRAGHRHMAEHSTDRVSQTTLLPSNVLCFGTCVVLFLV